MSRTKRERNMEVYGYSRVARKRNDINTKSKCNGDGAMVSTCVEENINEWIGEIRGRKQRTNEVEVL